MTQYVLTKPYRQFQPGFVMEPGAIIGDKLVQNGNAAIKVSRKEVMAAGAATGAYFPDAELRKIMIARGLVEAEQAERKVTKTSMLKRG